VVAAGLFAFQGPVLFLGHLATYDALCLALLALATVLALSADAAREPVGAMGVGAVLLAAVLLDALVVRTLLVPALMRLLGPANWWSPRPLRRLYERVAPDPA
jgi:RND superfamily putative drug exporter